MDEDDGAVHRFESLNKKILDFLILPFPGSSQPPFKCGKDNNGYVRERTCGEKSFLKLDLVIRPAGVAMEPSLPHFSETWGVDLASHSAF